MRSKHIFLPDGTARLSDALGTQVTRAAVQRLDMVLKVSVDSKKGHYRTPRVRGTTRGVSRCGAEWQEGTAKASKRPSRVLRGKKSSSLKLA